MIQETTTLWGTIKAKMAKFFSMAFIYLSPIHIMMFLIGAGIIADTIVGRWAAKKQAQKEGKDVRLEVTSRKTREGLLRKMIVYQAAIILVFMLDGYMLNDLLLYFLPNFPIHFAVTKLIGIVMLLVEFDSIDEKIYRVKGKRISTVFREQLGKIKKMVFKAKEEIKEFKDSNDNNQIGSSGDYDAGPRHSEK